MHQLQRPSSLHQDGAVLVSSGFSAADAHRGRLQGTGQGMEGFVPTFNNEASHGLSVGAVDLHG